MPESKENSFFRLPGVSWLSAKLSRQMILALLVLAVLGWMFSFSYLISDIKGHTANLYDEATKEASHMAQQVASFLEGSQGDWSELTNYLDDHTLGCCLLDDQGNILFQYMPVDQSESDLTAASSTTVQVSGQPPMKIHVWAPTLGRDDMLASIGHKTFAALTIFNLAIFLAAAVLIYVLILAPIINLRQTIRAYSEEGTLPSRSPRRDEVGRVQNAFADLTGLLKAKEESEHRLIASISHDIKTPLTSVLGYSERLLSVSLPREKQLQYAQKIHDKGLSIKTIVDEFDDYLDAGLKGEESMDRVSAGDLCKMLEQEYRSELADAGVELKIDCQCPDEELLCNLPHMSRCFGNLIGNSIRHAEAKQLVLSILCTREEDGLAIRFSDNGVGVPPALLQQIFEPLYTTDRGRKVSGLGLSICRNIVQAHGGSISAFNRPEGGLAVHMVIPTLRSKK